MGLKGKGPYILVGFELRRVYRYYIILWIEIQLIMDTQQLVEWGKQMNLEREKLCEFVRAEQAVARDEIIRISQEKKEERMAAIEDKERIAANAEKERMAAIEDEEMIAAKAEKERIAAIEDEERIAAKAEKERIAATEEAERIRQHEKDVLRIQVEADLIRSQENSMLREMNDSAYRPRNSGYSPKLPVFS